MSEPAADARPPDAPRTLAERRAADLRLRQCALTRTEHPVEDLIRFVLGPGGAIAPDLGGKLGGRGVWIMGTARAVTEAVKRNAFAKALKKQIKPPADLADLIERQMRERLLQALSFALKAGLVTTGFVKVETALATGGVAVLVQANDASEDGTDRLRRKFEALRAAAGRPAHLSRHFSSDELSMALGRTNVVHVSLAEGGQTGAFLRESLRLERFRRNDETMNDETDGSASSGAMASGAAPGAKSS